MTQPDTTDTAPPADDTTEDTPSAPPGTRVDADRGRIIATEPEPRSLPWWKQRAHEAEATGQWLHAELQAQNEALSARIETMQRQHAERMVDGRLHKASDLWKYGVTVAELLDDTGNVDPAKLDAAITELRADAPYLGPNPAAPSAQVTSAHAGVDESGNNTSFADLLRTAARSTRGIAHSDNGTGTISG